MEDCECFKIKVSLNLKAMRLEAGLTEAEVAQFMGIDEKNIRRWEAGTENISAETIFNLCTLYKKYPMLTLAIEDGDPLLERFRGRVPKATYKPRWRNSKNTLRGIINLARRFCQKEHIPIEEAEKMLRKRE